MNADEHGWNQKALRTRNMSAPKLLDAACRLPALFPFIRDHYPALFKGHGIRLDRNKLAYQRLAAARDGE